MFQMKMASIIGPASICMTAWPGTTIAIVCGHLWHNLEHSLEVRPQFTRTLIACVPTEVIRLQLNKMWQRPIVIPTTTSVEALRLRETTAVIMKNSLHSNLERPKLPKIQCTITVIPWEKVAWDLILVSVSILRLQGPQCSLEAVSTWCRPRPSLMKGSETEMQQIGGKELVWLMIPKCEKWTRIFKLL